MLVKRESDKTWLSHDWRKRSTHLVIPALLPPQLVSQMHGENLGARCLSKAGVEESTAGERISTTIREQGV